LYRAIYFVAVLQLKPSRGFVWFDEVSVVGLFLPSRYSFIVAMVWGFSTITIIVATVSSFAPYTSKYG